MLQEVRNLRRFMNILKNNKIRVWLICAVMLTFFSSVAYAEYTQVSSVKRVASAKASPGVMFSSNCMRTSTSLRPLTTSEYTVTVCNYDPENPTVYNPAEINYTLTAQLQVYYNGDYITMEQLKTKLAENTETYNEYVEKAKKYYIQKTANDSRPVDNIQQLNFYTEENDTVTFHDVNFSNESLATSQTSVDKFSVHIDEASLNNINPEFFVLLTATPEQSMYTPISTKLYGAKTIESNATWNGTFVEDNISEKEYDFYNYIISGSGEGTVDIIWDPTKIEINGFFLTELSGNTFLNNNNTPVTIAANDPNYSDKAGWEKITLEVNSLVKNRYELQLYKKIPYTSYTGEQSPDKFIECHFTKKTD